MGSVLDSPLVAEWLSGLAAIDVVDEASVSMVRESVRREGAAIGLSKESIESVAAAASELAHNHLRHGRGGQVATQTIRRSGVVGLELIAADRGAGIIDPSTAFKGELRSSGSLGIGLSAAYRLVDEMDVDVRLFEGTCVRVRKFASPLAKSEVAIFGRPHESETVSGDHATFLRVDDTILIGVADGLGHGAAAREASEGAISVVRNLPMASPLEILRACETPLEKSRGAVMAVARVDLDRGHVIHAGAGNISTQLGGPGGNHRFVSANRVLGGRSYPSKLSMETVPFSHRQVLIMFSDGLSSKTDLSADLALLREPPPVIAHQLVQRFGRVNDDVIVAVVR